MRRRLQTIAEEALGAATEKSVNEKRRSSEAKRRAFFFLAFRPSVVASERVCVFLCFVSFYTKRNESYLFFSLLLYFLTRNLLRSA